MQPVSDRQKGYGHLFLSPCNWRLQEKCFAHRDERNKNEIDDGQVLVMDLSRSLSEGQQLQGYFSPHL